jgi:hypothetical protein
MKQFGLSIIVAIGLTLPAFGQEMVKPEGIYVLNVAKSINRGPANKSATISFTADGFTGVGFGPDGKPWTVNATVIADGKPHAATTGEGLLDMSTYTQIDPYTLSISRTRNGKVFETGVRVVSPDGKTMWLTATGTTPNGEAYSRLSVFEKQ